MKPYDTPTRRWWEVASRFVHPQLSGDRGARARLRRATTTEALYSIEAAHTLVAGLGLMTPAASERPSARQLREQGLAYRLASLLAYLPEDAASVGTEFGKQLGQENGLSKLRFARLLRVREPAARYQEFRRALAQIKYRCHPGELALLFLRWDSEAVQRGVAYEYFQTSAPDPIAHPASPVAAAAAAPQPSTIPE